MREFFLQPVRIAYTDELKTVLFVETKQDHPAAGAVGERRERFVDSFRRSAASDLDLDAVEFTPANTDLFNCRFRKLTHAIWHCQYHMVWVPKYRFRVLEGEIGEEVRTCVNVFCEQGASEVVELNVQKGHVHLIAMVPPKVSFSDLMGG